MQCFVEGKRVKTMPGFRCLHCFHRRLGSVTSVKDIQDASCGNHTQQPSPRTHQDKSRLGPKVIQAIERLGKQRPSGGFLDEDGAIDASHAQVTKATRLHVETVQIDQLWSIKGMYHHQARRIGLRHMDRCLSENGLLDFPTESKEILLKRAMFADLLQGNRTLQTYAAAEIAAAQPDLPRLTFRQLLRLQVLLLDVSVSSNCHSARAFLQRLESLVYERFGLQCADHCAGKLHFPGTKGCEATTMIAASANLQAPTWWWTWWLQVGGSEQRWYFNAMTFTIAPDFPTDGVLEISDFSKPDHCDASATFIWMDWSVKYHKVDKTLSSSSPLSSKKSGIAGIVSPELLQDARGQLQSFKGSHL